VLRTYGESRRMTGIGANDPTGSYTMFTERNSWNIVRSFRLDAPGLDDLGPLLSLVHDEPAEFGRRACKHSSS